MLFLLLISLSKPHVYLYMSPRDTANFNVYLITYLRPSKFITLKGHGTAEIAVEVKAKKNVIYGNFWYVKVDTSTPSPLIKVDSFTVRKFKNWKVKVKIDNPRTGEDVIEEEFKKNLKDYCEDGLCLSDPIPVHGNKLSSPIYSSDTISFKFETVPEISRIDAVVKLYQEEKGFDVKVKGVVLTPEIKRVEDGAFIISFIMPDTLSRGEYVAGFEVKFDNQKSFKRRAVFIYRKGGSVLVGNLDDYIPALTYIAPYSEVKKLENAPPSEKMKLWKEFWKKHDPTPGTPENELEEEFVERVTYANKHFSVGKMLGSLTDRGHVYIKLGPPDEIDTHPFELNAVPYQVWYYYDQNLVVIFVDRGGFGDYELYYPADLFDRID